MGWRTCPIFGSATRKGRSSSERTFDALNLTKIGGDHRIRYNISDPDHLQDARVRLSADDDVAHLMVIKRRQKSPVTADRMSATRSGYLAI
jgi:hypothetical protein